MRSLRELLFPASVLASRVWPANSNGEGRQHRAYAWRELYVAALFETNKERLPQRIGQSKQALILRARELFDSSGDHAAEEMAIDDTFRALQALEQYELQAVSTSGGSALASMNLARTGSFPRRPFK